MPMEPEAPPISGIHEGGLRFSTYHIHRTLALATHTHVEDTSNAPPSIHLRTQTIYLNLHGGGDQWIGFTYGRHHSGGQ